MEKNTFLIGYPPKFNSLPLKNGGWMTTFLFGRYIFRGYVKLQVGNDFDTVPFHSGYPTGWCENLTLFFHGAFNH